MKVSKKIISILLALVMAFSLALPAFAETEKEMGVYTEVCASYDFHLENNKTVEYTFTAPQKGVYFFWNDYTFLERGVTISFGDFYEEEREPLNAEPSSEGTTFRILEKNETVIIKAQKKFNLSADKTFDFRVTVEYLGNNTLKSGKNAIKNDDRFYIFKPDKDGIYNFKASDKVYMSVIFDDSWDDDLSSLTVKLKAGQEYIVELSSDVDGNDKFVPYTVTTTYNPVIKADEAELELTYDCNDRFIIDRLAPSYAKIKYTPHSSRYTSGVTASFDKEGFADVEFTDDETIKITPHKIGKATMTLTTESGNQVSYVVYSVPYFVWLFCFHSSFLVPLAYLIYAFPILSNMYYVNHYAYIT